ncbi:MAG: TIGR01777 family oxidoreductase [Spirochaetes bacterium]|nr:TIGR01777 family oxidoreductase [Spirochaetota bacterium]
MKIFITGGLGFVGTRLTALLIRKGHGVTVIEHNPANKAAPPEGVSVISADASKPGPWQEVLAGHDAVVNLAGVSIFSRWTRQKKEAIYNSRILITRNVVDAMGKRKKGSIDLINASAVGYYGFHGDEALTENDPPGDDFLARVSRDWEAEALRAGDFGARVVLTRFGVILGRSGGAMDILAKIFRMRLGNRLGPGKQWFSWIHEDDLASALLFTLERRSLKGPVNCTAPAPVTNRELTRELNRALGTFPIVPPAPGFLLKMAMGEFGGFLLKGQKALPSRLQKEKFAFRYPAIREALADIIGKP